jgi:hypothetical protein
MNKCLYPSTHQATEQGVGCNYCGKLARLTNGAEIYRNRPDLNHLQFWLCSPCDAYVGCHKNSNAEPLGRLANKNLRAWKQRAHAAFDPLWKSDGMKRRDAYAWLAREMNLAITDCHIGMFDEVQCERVVQTVAIRGNDFKSSDAQSETRSRRQTVETPGVGDSKPGLCGSDQIFGGSQNG